MGITDHDNYKAMQRTLSNALKLKDEEGIELAVEVVRSQSINLIDRQVRLGPVDHQRNVSGKGGSRNKSLNLSVAAIAMNPMNNSHELNQSLLNTNQYGGSDGEKHTQEDDDDSSSSIDTTEGK